MTRQHDLFGPQKAVAPDRKADARAVTLQLDYEGETDGAWLLAKTGQPAKWVPKSRASRAEDGSDDRWTMPAGSARERGWL